MKKFIILSLVFLLILSSMAFAGKRRVEAMGNSVSIIDDSNIEMFPSRIIDFANLAVAEFDGSSSGYGDDFYSFGMNWMVDNDSKWTMGMYFETMGLSDDGNANLPFGYNNIPGFGYSYMDWNQRATFYYARPVGNNNLGFKFNYHGSSCKYEDDTPFNEEENLSNMNFILGLTEGSGQWDASLMFGTGSFTNETDGTAENEADGISQFGVMGRYFSVQNPNFTLVPHAGFGAYKFGIKDTDENWEWKENMFDIGCGVNFTPSNNVLAVFDFGIASYTEEFDYANSTTPASDFNDKTTWKTIPYFKLGLDAEVFKWLDARLGVTSDWHKEKNEFSGGNTIEEYGYAYNETSVGLGFHWNKLHIDTEANPEFFIEGPDFLSGADEDMAFSLSVIYEL